MSSERRVAIRMRELTKAYTIYAHPRDRLKQYLWPGKRKFYREMLAVRGISLDVHAGETLGIVGRNGSGKSTLLSLICGTLARTSGELSVDGHIAPILTLGAGFDPEFTGRENVIMSATVLGLAASEIGERMDSIIEFAAIGDFFDQPVKRYSSGMYARLAFAVAMNADPDILVVDEVLAVGDEAFTRKCFARIEEIKRAGSTVLFVSHSPQFVIELCDRAVLLEGGERLLTADPKTVIARYHRLLYASVEDYESTVQEIRDLDLSCGEDVRPASSPAPPPLDVESEKEDLGSYDAGLQPQSRTDYGHGNAVILRPRILDSNGRQVNVLRPGLEYTYAYEVSFREPACSVRFGMMIKLASGVELGGRATHLAGEGIPYVESHTTAEVRFCFRALLTPGTYFLNAGVLAMCGEEEDYLHRVLDALAFRIDPFDRSEVTGYVDFSSAIRPHASLIFAEEQPLRMPG